MSTDRLPGLVAMEECVEIMGMSGSRSDEEEEMIRKSEEGSYLVDGLCGLTELSDVLGIVFKMRMRTMSMRHLQWFPNCEA